MKKVETIRDELLEKMGAEDAHQLTKLRAAQDMTLLAELSLRASLMRTESRASHYRLDYPCRDDENWLNWIIISQKDNNFAFYKEPLPLDKYRIKIDQYYSDNFTFHELRPYGGSE